MYIEFVILDNFLLTYLAGAISARGCHKRVNVWRTLAASAVGTLAAVFYPFMRCGFWIQLLIKIALGCVLCVILFVKTKKPVTSSLLFFGSTFALGGAVYAVWTGLCSANSAVSAYCKQCPVFICLAVGCVVYFCSRYAIKKLKAVRARAPYEYVTDVEIFGCRLHFNAFLDTGNCVFDDRTGLPVVIADIDRFSGKLGDGASREFLKNFDGYRTIKIVTPAGETTARVVKPTKITVYSDRHGHTIEAMIGLVGGNKFPAAHEMLLNPIVIAEGA